jgi:hypothetical protein
VHKKYFFSTGARKLIPEVITKLQLLHLLNARIVHTRNVAEKIRQQKCRHFEVSVIQWCMI